MPAYEFEGLVPVVDPTAFVHPTAVLIGDVHIGPGCLVGPLVSPRGDFGRIEVREVMDRAVIGEYAFVAAHSVVPEGFEVPPRTLARGVPAKVTRDLTEAGMAWKANGTRVYQDLAVRYRATMCEVEPLAAPESDRPSSPGADAAAVPLAEYRRRNSAGAS
jgi:phenylacetic acid degradation protein